ncbi:MAG: hypothetical protein ABIU63_16910 [Chitinophagaceae bacterium]
MKSNLLTLAFGCSLLLLLSNCKKGDPGPAGATGPAGVAGPIGPVGTANVIYSPWINLTFTGSGTLWAAQITAAGVTKEIMDKGVVKTYFQFGSSVYDGNYTNLTGGGSSSIYQFLAVGVINLRSTFAANYPWRYVIIPGGLAGGRLSAGSGDADSFVFADGSTMRKTELDKMSYEDVCNKFNIPKD